MQGVTQFKDVTLEYASTAAFTVNVLTDMPGDALGIRKTLTFPSTGSTVSRNKITLPLDGIEGKLIKFAGTVPAGGAVVLFRGSYQARIVGTYLDGTRGDIWEVGPLSPGA